MQKGKQMGSTILCLPHTTPNVDEIGQKQKLSQLLSEWQDIVAHVKNNELVPVYKQKQQQWNNNSNDDDDNKS